MTADTPLLAMRDLRVQLATPTGPVQTVNGVNLQLAAGESLGIVGESGAGKSQLALATMGLLPPSAQVSGALCVDGEDLLTMSARRRRALYGSTLAMIFQDPMRALNPYLRIGTQITEAMPKLRGAAAREAACQLLDAVRIPQARARLRQYPHTLSGGQRQRVMIAIALAGNPKLLIADEATTALDVTVQAGILALLNELRAERGLALLMISHDLGVIRESCERTAVMYAGRIIETGSTDALTQAPAHPYTDGLLRARPSLHGAADEDLPNIPGVPPDPRQLPQGCAFAPRCARADSVCERMPELLPKGATHVACHHPLQTG